MGAWFLLFELVLTKFFKFGKQDSFYVILIHIDFGPFSSRLAVWVVIDIDYIDYIDFWYRQV